MQLPLVEDNLGLALSNQLHPQATSTRVFMSTAKVSEGGLGLSLLIISDQLLLEFDNELFLTTYVVLLSSTYKHAYVC